MADSTARIGDAGSEAFRAIFDGVSDGIFVTDAQNGTFTHVNDAGCALLGYAREELIGRNIGFVSTGVPPYTQENAVKIHLESGTAEALTFEWQCRAKDGHFFWAEISFRTVLWAERGLVGLAILRDITRRKRKEEELVQTAKTDALTGLPNRRDFESVLQHEVARSERYDRPLCLAIADIDHFKEVNDTYGHPVGDVVLKWLAEFMRAGLRRTDYIARWGGEEFAILLPETKPDDAEGLLNRLRGAIAKSVIPGLGREVTVSFGLTAHARSDDAEAFLARADHALYLSKASGRNRVAKA